MLNRIKKGSTKESGHHSTEIISGKNGVCHNVVLIVYCVVVVYLCVNNCFCLLG